MLAIPAKEAAGLMHLTAQDLAELHIIDRIIPEFGGATEETADQISKVMRQGKLGFIKRYRYMSGDDIERERYARFRSF